MIDNVEVCSVIQLFQMTGENKQSFKRLPRGPSIGILNIPSPEDVPYSPGYKRYIEPEYLITLSDCLIGRLQDYYPLM